LENLAASIFRMKSLDSSLALILLAAKQCESP
jgi:hypothetical protein